VITLTDILFDSVCPNSQTNSSVLLTTWIEQNARISSDLRIGTPVALEFEILGKSRLAKGRIRDNAQAINIQYYEEDGVDYTVTRYKRLSEQEYLRGEAHTSFRVFPTMCPDGNVSYFEPVLFENVTVNCNCDLISLEDYKCICTDEFYPNGFFCNYNGIGFKCEHDGLEELNESLLSYITTEVDTSICFFNEETSSIRTSQTVVKKTRGIKQVLKGFELELTSEEDDNSYLIEVKIQPCQEKVVLTARANLLSDDFEEIPYDSVCSPDGLNQTIWPLYQNILGGRDLFDQWVIENFTSNVTYIVPLFSPNGIPVNISSIAVSSNDPTKANVLMNDLTYWESEDTDLNPMLTLTFYQPQPVIGLILIIRSLGIPILTTNDTLPATLQIQLSKDGLIWITKEKITSTVYNSQEEWIIQLPTNNDDLFIGVRIFSIMNQLSINQLIPLTNQLCQNDNILILTPSNIIPTSIVSATLNLILQRDVNDEELCECYNNCVIGNITVPSDTDTQCADKLYVSSLGIYPEYVHTLFDTFTVDEIFDRAQNNTNYTGNSLFYYNETAKLGIWWFPTDDELLDEQKIPTGFQPDLSIVPNTLQTVLYNYTYIIVGPINDTIYQDILNTADGSISSYLLLDIVERGLACRTGSHCARCGISNRKKAIDPVFSGQCELSDFQLDIKDDYINRTGAHIVKNSATLKEYLLIKEQYIIKLSNITLTRDHLYLNKPMCSVCQREGKLQCKTGECVKSIDDCPIIHYNNEGDGCYRVTTKEKKFHCVCKPGHGGLHCDLIVSRQGDPKTGLINPYEWASCGNDPPLVIQPGRSLVAPLGNCYENDQLELINNDGIVLPADETRMIRVGYSWAPYGNRVLRCYRKNGRKMWSNCPYYKIGPFGEKLMLEDTVIRDPETNKIIGQVQFRTPEGINITYEWSPKISKYDDAPYRCPNGACVADEKDCFDENERNPICGGGGSKCRVDGTCDCASGKKTFLYSPEWTDRSMIPYDVSNPTIWGKRYASLNIPHCQARDCSDGTKCQPPFGCYSGSPENNFRDAHVLCPTTSGPLFAGKCAKDFKACERGEVTEPAPCSFNGFIRQRADRPDEYYCDCGKPRSRIFTLAENTVNVSRGRETIELIKNGWGGYACEDYYCKENTRQLHYSQRDPVTHEPYRDIDLTILPGKWIGGSCGAPNGPLPSDIGFWSSCCAGYPNLRQCPKVLCLIANRIECVLPSECRGSERRPKIYPCHGGRARADGTCECPKESNYGWGPDETGEGCFRRIQCAVDERSEKICNSQVEEMGYWPIIPRIPSWESYFPIMMLRMGIQPTTENMVRMVVRDPDRLYSIQRQGLVSIALDILNQILASTTAICLMNANEDPANPLKMSPFVGREEIVGPYQKAFKFPYELQNFSYTTLPSINIDSKFVYNEPLFNYPPRLNLDYEIWNKTTHYFNFTNSTYITHVKIFAAIGETFDVKFEFIGDDGINRCETLQTRTTNYLDFKWLGINGFIQCSQTWSDVVFNTLDGWAIACKGNELRLNCLEWKDNVCSSIPGGIIQLPSSLKILPGCTSRCCVPKTIQETPTSSFIIRVDGVVHVQEVVVFGYTNQILPLVGGLLKEVQFKQGWAINPHAGGQCRDHPYLKRDEIVGPDGDYYVARKYIYLQNNSTETPQLRYDTAKATCEDTGGKLATSRNDPDNVRFYGEKCFSQRGGDLSTKTCIIEARNRNELLEPLLTNFIVNTCSTWGCWICPNDNCLPYYGIDFVSTPDTTGTKWTTEWYIVPDEFANPGFISSIKQMFSWTQIATSWMTVSQGQRAMSLVSSGISSNSADDTIFNSYHRFLVKYEQLSWCQMIDWTPFWYQPRFRYNDYSTNMQVRSYNEFQMDANNQVRKLSDGLYSQIWSTNKTCRVTIYSESVCGEYNSASDGRAKGVFLVSPKNDYSLLFQTIDLSQYTYSACSNGASSCSDLGVRISDRFKSISVSGDCIAEFTFDLLPGRVGSNTWRFGPGGIGRVPLGFQQVSVNGPDKKCVTGCIPQCYEGWGCLSDLSGGPLAGIGGDSLEAIPTIVNAKPRTLKIYPYFSADLVEVNVRAPRSAVGNSDTYYMGWQTHPFMCARIDARVLKSISSSTTTLSVLRSHSRPNGNGQVNAEFQDITVFTGWATVSGANIGSKGPARWSRNVNGNLLPKLFSDKSGLENIHECNGINLPRYVQYCPNCIVQQPPGKWQFDQRKYNELQGNKFTIQMNLFRQTNDLNGIGSPVPEIFVNWKRIGGLDQKFQKLASLRNVNSDAYARLISNIIIQEYRTRFFLDNCVKVVYQPNEVLRYSFDTTICEAPIHYALCQRDYIKYTCQPGRCCDECGNSARSSGLPQPGLGVFEQFTKARKETNEQAHFIKDSYLEGKLDDLIKVNYIDYDVVWDFINNDTIFPAQSLIYGLPKARELIQLSYSDCPGSATTEVINYETCVDFNWKKIWPFQCGTKCKDSTGECYRRMAISSEYCDPDSPQFPLREIPLSSYPLALLPIPSNETFNKERCGVSIYPNSYVIFDEWGISSPTIPVFFTVLEQKQNYVIARSKRTGTVTWSNTGKSSSGYYVNNQTTIYGQISVPSNVIVSLWVSLSSPTYSDTSKIYLGNLTNTEEFVINATQYLTNGERLPIIGWDFYNVHRGDIITIYKLLVTDPTTIRFCQQEKKYKIYDHPSSVDMADSKNVCVYNIKEDIDDEKYYDRVEPGTCFCPSPNLDGPSCSSPSIISTIKGQKEICGGFGRPGYNYYDYHGNIVPVDDDGVWTDETSLIKGCVTINIGMAFRTRLEPTSRYDFLYLYLSDRQYGELDFDVVDLLLNEDTGDFVSLDFEGQEKTCKADSKSVSSWLSGDESSNFISTLITNSTTFVDLVATDSNYLQFRWNEREILFNECSDSGVACGTILSTNPCDNKVSYDYTCESFNWNNLLFDRNNNISDGTMTTAISYTSSTQVNLQLNSVVYNTVGVLVRIWSSLQPAGVSVIGLSLVVTPCSYNGQNANLAYEYECDYVVSGIEKIRITIGGSTTIIYECRVYETDQVTKIEWFTSL
jgi:hypothetical protein